MVRGICQMPLIYGRQRCVMAPFSSERPFEGIWEALGMQPPEPLGEEDGYRWGMAHLEYVKKELSKLEERALARRDKELLYSIANSKLKARDAEQELRQKLGIFHG